MMIYPIVAYGHPVLKKRAEEIPVGTPGMKELADDMFETMYQAQGIGLAAPQIGKSIRMFVADGSPLEEEDMQDFKLVFINPEMIEEFDDPWLYEEGCLSIPGVRDDVSRRARLRIRFYDENWVRHEREYDGMKARIIQHEYDHLEGVLFTDRISAFRRRLLKARLTGISKGQVKVDYRMTFPNR
jgi:peptide deformylase